MESNFERLKELANVAKYLDILGEDVLGEILWFLECQDSGSAEDEVEAYDSVVESLNIYIDEDILTEDEVDEILSDLE